jgi:hypothetical protein
VYGKALQRLLALQNSSVCVLSLSASHFPLDGRVPEANTHLCSNDCNAYVLDAPRVECFVRANACLRSLVFIKAAVNY